MQISRMVFERVLALTVALLVVMGASIMVMQRIYHDRWYYVSEFGAAGLETEEDFKVGFTMLACGILLAAWPLRTVTRTSSGRRLFVMPWMTVGLAGVCFFVASQVNCTESCPSLANPEATTRDLVHVWFAIAGFVFGCLTMLLMAAARKGRLRHVTIVAAIAIGVISGTGGLLSLAGSTSELGAILEHVATGIGLVWLLWAVFSEVGRSQRNFLSELQRDTRRADGESTHQPREDPALDQA
ncbi:DUF998 domain-containing protein [Agrococcus casei]|uniref:DUF998 domain-containing protein n=1 Tax=Agrococcus casei TaxID=343512 RepID=UPI001356521E|nr:DUF998 domain-containing protein [Agrococcus casei]